jgi:serine/threonine-protein kinase
MSLSEGDIIAGKYRVERVLGSGGMGHVYAALHLRLGTGVAIKVLRPEAAADTATVGRFLREARSAARLQSEHAARVTDVATLDSGAPYIVMELLRGEDLSRALAMGGPLPVHLAVQYLLEACEAVAEAHALGIVHRDLKPANLFLAQRADGSPYVKVLDFGISKRLHTAGDAAASGVPTGSGAMLGTPHYMSPEQIRSARSIDPRTDVWALGATLYELLTNRKPFDGETLPAVFVAIANDAPSPPSTHRPDVPPALEALVLACLEKLPERRPQSVAELARRLAPFAPTTAAPLVERVQRLGKSGHVQDTPATASASQVPGTREPQPAFAATERAWGNATSQQPGGRDRRTLFLGASALALLVVGAGLALPSAVRSRSHDDRASTTAGAPVAAGASTVPAFGDSAPSMAASVVLAPLTNTPSAGGSAAPSASAASIAKPATPGSTRRPPAPPPNRGKKDESSQTLE